MSYSVCPDCGAVSYGNITCRTCRQYTRELSGPSEFLDKLDALNIATQPPLGPEAIRAFLEKLERENQ